jgi:hypothetical protein
VVIIAALIAILKIIIPYALSKLGWSEVTEGVSVVLAVLRIIIWAIIIIFVIYVCFALIACLLGWAPHLSLMPH